MNFNLWRLGFFTLLLDHKKFIYLIRYSFRNVFLFICFLPGLSMHSSDIPLNIQIIVIIYNMKLKICLQYSVDWEKTVSRRSLRLIFEEWLHREKFWIDMHPIKCETRTALFIFNRVDRSVNFFLIKILYESKILLYAYTAILILLIFDLSIIVIFKLTILLSIKSLQGGL